MLNRTVCIAPMMGYTNRHARYFLRLISKHVLLYTEMVTTGAVLHGDRNKLLHYHPDELPLAIQLGGSDPAELSECSRIAEDAGVRKGRLILVMGGVLIVGLVAGAAHELDMRTLMRKRGMIRGTTLRNRSLHEKIAATRAFGDFALPLLATGRLRPVIHAVLPMAEAGAAHRMLEADSTYGKVVLSWSSPPSTAR